MANYSKLAFYFSVLGGIASAITLYDRFILGRPEQVFAIKTVPFEAIGTAVGESVISVPIPIVLILITVISYIIWKEGK